MSNASGRGKKERKCSQQESEETAYYSERQEWSAQGGSRKGSAELELPQPKYKTEVCDYWKMGEVCPFGQSCNFAHGHLQIRSKGSLSNKYKTKKCLKYSSNYVCAYGHRCQFIHNQLNMKISRSALGAVGVLGWFYDQPDILQLVCKSRPSQNLHPTARKWSIDQYPDNSQQESMRPAETERGSFIEDPERYDEDLLSLGFPKPRLYSL